MSASLGEWEILCEYKLTGSFKGNYKLIKGNKKLNKDNLNFAMQRALKELFTSNEFYFARLCMVI